MYIHTKTLDDLLRDVFNKLLKSKNLISSTRGDSYEEYGVLLQLNNPTARLSRTEKKATIFSCLGELLWYLSGSNELDFIKYYIPLYAEDSEDDKTIYGGYGPRLLNKHGINQLDNILSLLKQKPQSRRAVIQIFDAEDITINRKEIPCTCTFQFLIREKKLHMITSMRSNDAFIGLPHDFFAFTMMQEIIARSLNLKLGIYKHFVGSLHLYTKNLNDAKQYLSEGWQDVISMPEMPFGDPWPSINVLLEYEHLIRNGEVIDVNSIKLEPYWKDFVLLLLIYRYLKDKNYRDVVHIKNHMSTNIYENYIRKKLTSKVNNGTSQIQLEIPTT